MTVMDLLKRGYHLVESYTGFAGCEIDMERELEDWMYNSETKEITCYPFVRKLLLESIEIDYKFASGTVKGMLSLPETTFSFSYNGNVLDKVLHDMMFDYSSFAWDLKNKYPQISGDLREVSIHLWYADGKGGSVEYRAYYFPTSFNIGVLESYTSTGEYRDGELVSSTDILMLNEVYDLEELFAKADKLIK